MGLVESQLELRVESILETLARVELYSGEEQAIGHPAPSRGRLTFQNHMTGLLLMRLGFTLIKGLVALDSILWRN